MKNCKQCNKGFEITGDDRKFYDRVSPLIVWKKYAIPEPSLCPHCREQRRLVWRNERKLYKRKCGLCGKKMISIFSEDKPFPVYCLDCWWGDKWNAFEYGRDFDFSKTFFEQFKELRDKTPHFAMANLHATMENSDYCNHAGYLKNCYLIFNSDQSEQCLYGKGMNRCFDCVDGFKIYDCEACYEAINSNNCKFCSFVIDCYTCDNCHFSANLIGCKNCFGCVNLRNKEFCFFNETLSPDEYKKKVRQMRSEMNQEEIMKKFLDFRKTQVVKWMQEKNTENCTGDYLVQCKNCFECYDCEYLENSKYCTDLKKGDKVSFDNHDISYFGMGIEASYECSVGGYNANHICFCENVWDSSDVFYSQQCMNSQNLFGCMSLGHAKYSILNKQYSKEEYEKLVPKIILHMKKTNEWGEYFPHDLTPYGYSETVAQEYYPLVKDEVINNGWNWIDEKEPDYSDVTKKIPASQLPADIKKIPDDILNWAIECSESGRLFKIQKAELEFYRRNDIPIPKYHPDVRHQKRFALRDTRSLYDRKCGKCGVDIKTTYSPGRPEKVYCEKCYLESVY